MNQAPTPERAVREFAAHLFPRVVREGNLKVRYTLCLGGLSLTALLLSSFSGVLLLFYYQPAPGAAYDSILFLEEQVVAGRFMRSLHRVTSDGFLVLMFLHTLRVLFTGAYRRPRELNWLVGCALFLLAIFESYTGYLLPMDQLALWATQTGMELVAAVPGGAFLRDLLTPDGPGGSLSLLRFYSFHILVVPLAMAILTSLHFYRIRRDRGLLPYL